MTCECMNDEVAQSLYMAQLKVYDYVNNLISTLPQINNSTCDFSILCEKYPIMVHNNTFRARVLHVVLTNKEHTERIYPDKLTDLGLAYILITTNYRRTLSIKSQEFFVNGNTTSQEYKGNTYYNYSIEKANVSTKNKITQLRQKNNIAEPSIFVGKHQDLVLA